MDEDGGNNSGILGHHHHHFPRRLRIEPPLFNSANPWATTLDHLRSLYACKATGAVTTRTALLGEGFPHDDATHRYAFFETAGHGSCLLNGDRVGEEVNEIGNENEEDEQRGKEKKEGEGEGGKGRDASLNNLGYSPIPLDGYLDFIRAIDRERRIEEKEMEGEEEEEGKPFIVSVTGTPDEVAECYRRIARCRFGRAGDREGEGVGVSMPLAMEVNLSCPNIPGKPPPAYEGEALKSYIRRITEAAREVESEYLKGKGEKEKGGYTIPWGVKTPPYTHAGQFGMFVSALRDCAVPIASSLLSVEGGNEGEETTATTTTTMTCPLTFVTATNTLGSCLLLDNNNNNNSPVLPGPGLGIGGMAGAPLHPLALGNVATLRRMLDEARETRHVLLLGIGGVSDAEGYRRMRSVGAAAVGIGTALGIKGIGVFEEVESGLGGVWEV